MRAWLVRFVCTALRHPGPRVMVIDGAKMNEVAFNTSVTGLLHGKPIFGSSAMFEITSKHYECARCRAKVAGR